MTLKELGKIQRTSPNSTEIMKSLTTHYENLGYKVTADSSYNPKIVIKKDNDTVTVDSYCDKISVGYSGNKYRRIITIVEKIDEEFRKKQAESQRNIQAGNMQKIMVDSLNACNLKKSYDQSNIYSYSSRVSETVTYKDARITVTINPTDEPKFSCTSRTAEDFTKTIEFMAVFEDAYLAARL